MGHLIRRVVLGVRRRLGRPPGERLVPFAGGLLVWADPTDAVERSAWLRGGYEDDVAALLRAAIEEGDLAIDVGAHSGLHTVRLARAVGARGRVVAFEPNPAMAARLARNLDANGLGDRVVVHVAGASRERGSALLHLSDDPDNSGGSSLEGQRSATTTIAVDLVSIDAVVSADDAARVVAVKIDVEGHEAAVLAGAANVLDRHPVVVVESNSLAAIEALLDRGFLIHELVGGRLVAVVRGRVSDVVRPGTATNLVAIAPGSAAAQRLHATHGGPG